MVILIVIASVCLLLYILGMLFSNIVINIKCRTRQQIFDIAVDNKEFTLEEFGELIKDEISVESIYGYTLKGFNVRKKSEISDKVMVFSHGVTTNCLSSIKYGKYFLDRGWDIIIYDHRRHGDTKGKFTTYGFLEKHDLDAVIQYVKKEYGPHITLGVHGESMGSAIALMEAGRYNNADFYIFDCPFSSFYDQLKYRIRIDYKLAGFFIIPLSNFFSRVRASFNYRESNPIDYVDRITKPSLFIHSENDNYIPVKMTKDLYEKAKCIKQLYIAPNGDHAESLMKNKDEYYKQLDKFLTDILN